MYALEALEMLGGLADRSTLLALTSRKALRKEVRAGTITRSSRGRYALPTADAAVAAAHAVSGVVAGRSAAAWWGWELKTQPDRPEVAVPKHRRSSIAHEGIDLTWVDLHPSEVHQGLVTTRERTLIDCLRRLPFDEALAVADSALRHGFGRDRLLALAASTRGPGARQVRRVAARASALAANPFESVLRALAIECGLDVEPQVSLPVRGGWMQPDVVDAARSLVLEADSFEWHGKRAALRRDARRYCEMVVSGWLVLRFAYEDVMHDQDWVRGVLRDVAEIGDLITVMREQRTQRRTERRQTRARAG